MVLVLFETAVGFCLFSMSDEAKLNAPDLYKHFEEETKANRLLQLSAIHRFQSTADAVEGATAVNEGKLSKGLKNFLTEEILEKQGKGKSTKLIVSEPKLASTINKKLGIQVTSESSLMDLYRGIRENLASLLSSGSPEAGALDPRDLNTMSLGLSHSLSRYKLKFSPDKVDTMVVQAIALLDDLDKELNIYAMRVKEWYGWHFPEMGKIITDNVAYAKVVRAMGFRTNASSTDMSDILPEEVEQTLKAAAEISMGTEISDSDMEHIWSLCDQVISISEYRAQLYSYLCNRMAAIAPNLTALVGELVGARLISHAGSILNLAKLPASTIQILGAEKALFRALKTKHDTPKYGLLYHSSLVGMAPPKMKGKMARMVATKAALSTRLDALADVDAKSDVSTAATIGADSRARLEARARGLEHVQSISGIRANRGNDAGYQQKSFAMQTQGRSYNPSADAPPVVTGVTGDDDDDEEDEDEDDEDDAAAADRTAEEPKKKKDKKDKKEKKEKKEKKDKKEKKEKKSKRSASELDDDASSKKKKKKSSA